MSTTPGPNAEAIAKLRAIMADDPTKGRSPTGGTYLYPYARDTY
jgi:hypothetical protein